MKFRYLIGGALVLAALAFGFVRAGIAQAAAPAQHEAHMAAMQAADAKVDALVKKMNAATGQAKIDAMAELLNAFADNHKNVCGPMMADMMSGMGGSGAAKPAK